MDYNTLMDLVEELGYRLAMCGAETFRIEESVNRILAAYGIESEVFAIPNCLIVSIETLEGKPMTRMRRIGYHGNDLDSVEKYSNLSRRICAEKPEPATAKQWLHQTELSRRNYPPIMTIIGSALGGCGFSVLFGATFSDAVCAAACGALIGVVDLFMSHLKANQFFRIITESFLMSMLAYAFGGLGIANSCDAIIIGALMLLVPGLLFTNAMRDIIFGDTNSGTNRIVQVLLIAAAIALGTGSAWSLATILWGVSETPILVMPAVSLQLLASLIGCLGFGILFNIHGPGMLLCALGGVISWAAFCLSAHLGANEIMSSFIAAIIAALYSETMARIRKYPAISYLTVSIFPMLPGAGIYYTSNYLVQGNMQAFSEKGLTTVGIAGVLAVGILLVSTLVRLWTVWKQRKHL
jgi:uncharacterized membrane protein YjjP (DUF1212 family)